MTSNYFEFFYRILFLHCSCSRFLVAIMVIFPSAGTGGGTALQARISRVGFPMMSFGVFHGLNPFGRTVALGSTQSPTEMSARNTSWGVKASGA
jgi:hypothetical protein